MKYLIKLFYYKYTSSYIFPTTKSIVLIYISDNVYSCDSSCMVLWEIRKSKQIKLPTLPEHFSSPSDFQQSLCLSIFRFLSSILQIVVCHFSLFAVSGLSIVLEFTGCPFDIVKLFSDMQGLTNLVLNTRQSKVNVKTLTCKAQSSHC